MKNLTPEVIAKAKEAKSAEELFALAKENNVELTEDEAKTYFEQLNANGTVSDEDLDAVAGGSFLGLSCPGEEAERNKIVAEYGKLTFTCPHCKREIQWKKELSQFTCPICGKLIKNAITSSCI